MKGFLVGIIVLVILGLFGFFALKNFQKSYVTPGSSAQVTLVGVLQPISGNDQYSYLIVVNGQTIGVASTRLNLKQYEGKKVQITGQYSGTTIYADQIQEAP